MSHRLKIEYFWDRTELNLLVKFFPGLESVGSRFESVPCASRFLCLPAPKWRAKYYKYNASIHTNHVTLGGQPPLMIMTLCCFFHLGRGLNKKIFATTTFQISNLIDAKLPVIRPVFLRTLRERRLFDVDVEVILADDAMIESKTPVNSWRFPSGDGMARFFVFFGGWIYRRLLGIESHLSVECPDTRVHLKGSKVLEGWYPVGEISRKICA